MMFKPAQPQPQAHPRTRKYLRGSVACKKCGAPHNIHKVDAVATDFSTRCPACSQRNFYSKAELTIEQMPERRRAPRKS